MPNYDSQSQQMSVASLMKDLTNEDVQIDLDPIYQRCVVWKLEDQQLFLNSVYHNMIPDGIKFYENDNGTSEVIDGKQRLTSLLLFAQNKICFNINDIDDESEENEMYVYHREIPKQNKFENARVMSKEERATFGKRMVDVKKYFNISYEERRKLFVRIQFGKQASHGELINSFFTNPTQLKIFSSFCESHSENIKKFIHKIDRKEHCDFLLKALYLIDEETPNSLLRKKVDNYTKIIDTNEEKANFGIKVINKVLKILFVENGLLNEIFTSKNVRKNWLLYLIKYIAENYKIVKNCKDLKTSLKTYFEKCFEAKNNDLESIFNESFNID